MNQAAIASGVRLLELVQTQQKHQTINDDLLNNTKHQLNEYS